MSKRFHIRFSVTGRLEIYNKITDNGLKVENKGGRGREFIGQTEEAMGAKRLVPHTARREMCVRAQYASRLCREIQEGATAQYGVTLGVT